MIRNFILAAVLVGTTAVMTGGLAADACPAACDLFMTCTVKKHGRQPTAEESKKGKAGCMLTCSKKTAGVTGCYNKAKAAADSCATYEQCITAAATAK